jgi:hypothetical protein
MLLVSVGCPIPSLSHCDNLDACAVHGAACKHLLHPSSPQVLPCLLSSMEGGVTLNSCLLICLVPQAMMRE